MTLASSSDPSAVPQYPIGTNPPKSAPWNPVEIVYAQLTMTDPGNPSTALMNPVNYVIPLQPGQPDPVGAFIKLRQSNPDAPVQHSGVYPNNAPNQCPCDVFVEQQCYLVIEIDHTIPWQFCTSQPCITLKGLYQHNGDDDNFGLTLDPSGKFASFCVAIRSASSGPGAFVTEGFNIVLQSQGSAVPTIYVIDPDTTNQGSIPPTNP